MHSNNVEMFKAVRNDGSCYFFHANSLESAILFADGDGVVGEC